MAIQLDPESAEAHYSYGLTLLAMDYYEEAAKHAAEARRLGYPLKGLMRLLEEAGYWLGEEESDGTRDESPTSQNL